MATEITAYLTTTGELVRTRAEAEQVEAWEAIMQFARQDCFRKVEEDVIVNLVNNHGKDFLVLLKTYVEASERRMNEVMETP